MTESQVNSLKKKYDWIVKKGRIVSENGKNFVIIVKANDTLHKFDKASAFVHWAKNLKEFFQ